MLGCSGVGLQVSSQQKVTLLSQQMLLVEITPVFTDRRLPPQAVTHLNTRVLQAKSPPRNQTCAQVSVEKGGLKATGEGCLTGRSRGVLDRIGRPHRLHTRMKLQALWSFDSDRRGRQAGCLNPQIPGKLAGQRSYYPNSHWPAQVKLTIPGCAMRHRRSSEKKRPPAHPPRRISLIRRQCGGVCVLV